MSESVGLGINPPPSGFDMLNTILGIQQKKQALQSQALQIQTQQAGLVAQQQNAKEVQAVAPLLADPIKSGILNADGSPADNAQSIIMSAAPTSGAERYNQIITAAKSKLDFNKSANALNSDERGEISNWGTGAAANPNAKPQDVIAALDAGLASKQGSPEYQHYQTLVNQQKTIISHLAEQGSTSTPGPSGSEPWRQTGVFGFNRALLGATGLTGAGGIANPAQGTNAANQNQLVNPITGERSMPQLSGGATNPSGPTVAGQTTRQVATGNADIDRGNQISAAVQPATNAIAVTKEIDDLAEQIKSGKFAAAISKAAAAAGQSSETSARQVIEKDINRLRALSSTGTTSDAQRDTINGTIPPPESDPQTIHNAMDYVRGTFKQNLARSNQLNQVKAKDSSLQGFQHADDIYTAGADPLMHEFQSLSTQQQQTAFLKRHFVSKTDAQQFIGRVAGFNHVTGQ